MPNHRVPGLIRTLTVLAACLGSGAASYLAGICGPFTDVSDAAFCPFVLEVFYAGITTGTTPTTYDPATSVSRLQMAAFLSRTVDGTLKRAGRRTAMRQTWNTQNANALGVTTVGTSPFGCEADGLDVWVTNISDASVSRVRAASGNFLGTWTGATNAREVLVAMGKVLVTGGNTPGKLYRIDPTEPAGVVTTVASNLGIAPFGITFDGGRVWVANAGGSVSIVTPGVAIPWAVTSVSTGFQGPIGSLFDGSNVWVTDFKANRLFKLDAFGAILQTVTVGTGGGLPAFDGTNIWVPNSNDNSVTVVRASSGAVLTTLTGNGQDMPFSAAFDGERVLVTSQNGDAVSLWKAANLSPLESVFTGSITAPTGVCSDGIHFWIALQGSNHLARF